MSVSIVGRPTRMLATYFATSPRRFRLDSDCSLTSEGSVESVFSYQNAETDHVQDSLESQDEYQISFDDDDDENGVVEYEPRSSEDDEDDENCVKISSSDSEDERMRVALSAAVCLPPKKDFWLTEAEDSESDQSNLLVDRQDKSPVARDFLKCVECNVTNHHPRFKYCDSCYQVRKRWYGGSRVKKRRRHRRTIKQVQVIARRLMDKLKDAEKDSGQGSSQEPHVDVDPVSDRRVTKLHHFPGTSQSRPEEIRKETAGSGMRKRKYSDSGVSDSSEAKRPALTANIDDANRGESRGFVVATRSDDVGVATSPTITVPLSDVVAAKALLDANNGAVDVFSTTTTSSRSCQIASDAASICASQSDTLSLGTMSQSDALSTGASQSDTASITTQCHFTVTDACASQSDTLSVSATSQSDTASATTWRHRDAVSAMWNGDIGVGHATPYVYDENDCIICQEARVDAIFLHPNVGHVCSCYRCGKEVWKRTKRCPVCNLPAYKVIRYYKS